MSMLIMLLLAAFAGEVQKPAPETSELVILKAEVESLKAEIQLLRIQHNYELQSCAMPDLMIARQTFVKAFEKLESARKAAAPDAAQSSSPHR